jgi:hypothetical protein
VSFEPEAFVAECRAALREDDAPTAVREVVAAAVSRGAAVDAALGSESPTYPSALFDSVDLTVQRITWWPGYHSLPHEHETAVHSVENPLRRRTAGLHVYGGPVLTQPRSAWAPDGREQPFDENAGLERTMFLALRGVAADATTDLDDDTKYRAMRALVAARADVGRYLTETEMRAITRNALGIADG